MLSLMQPVLSLDVAILDESLLYVLLKARPDMLSHLVHSCYSLHEVGIDVVHLPYCCDSLTLLGVLANSINLFHLAFQLIFELGGGLCFETRGLRGLHLKDHLLHLANLINGLLLKSYCLHHVILQRQLLAFDGADLGCES